MNDFFQALGRQLKSPHRSRASERHARAKAFRCVCGQQVFFNNSECLNCHRQLGFDPKRGHVLALDPGKAEGLWIEAGRARGRTFRRCANYASPAACNWLLPATASGSLCQACGLNRTIPDLSIAENGPLWGKVEAAKRQLVAQLLTLGLPIRRSQAAGDGGLAFDLLAAAADGAPLLTGHNRGLITLNIREADDAYRDQVREAMHEPYRTLLGHFRHEIGHFYWDQLVAGGPWLAPFRALFGDERADYAQALRRNYEQGPPADWAGRFISTYASCHPWEDWAETWAHYLHMMDTLDTAISFGVTRVAVQQAVEPFTRVSLYDPDDPEGQGLLDLVNAWVALTGALNELSRSMGQRDFYPFVLPAAVVGKLQFVHRVIRAAAR